MMKSETKVIDTVTDPICGMTLEPAVAAQSRVHKGQTVFFCSDKCASQFDQDPQRYLQNDGATTQPIAQSATTGYNPHLVGPLRVELPVAGLTCATCATTVERSLAALPGIEQVHVNYTLGRAHVTYDPQRAEVAQMVEAVKRAGYTVGADEMHVQVSNLYCASCVETNQNRGQTAVA